MQREEVGQYMKTPVAHEEKSSSCRRTNLFFPEGIIGFNEHKEYVIVQEKSKEPFYWIQSAEDPEVNFIIIDPLEFKDDYEPVLSEADKSILRINEVKECKKKLEDAGLELPESFTIEELKQLLS